jgi:hypothetical protein
MDYGHIIEALDANVAGIRESTKGRDDDDILTAFQCGKISGLIAAKVIVSGLYADQLNEEARYFEMKERKA